MPLLPPQRERAKKESVKSQKYGQVQNAAICKVAKCKKGIKKMAILQCWLTFSHRTPSDICNTPFSNYTTRGRYFHILESQIFHHFLFHLVFNRFTSVTKSSRNSHALHFK